MAIHCANACTFRKADGICKESVCYNHIQNIQLATKMYQNRYKASFYTEDGLYFGSPAELCRNYGISTQRFLEVVKSGMYWVEALNFCIAEQATKRNEELARERGALADACFGLDKSYGNDGRGFGE